MPKHERFQGKGAGLGGHDLPWMPLSNTSPCMVPVSFKKTFIMLQPLETVSGPVCKLYSSLIL